MDLYLILYYQKMRLFLLFSCFPFLIFSQSLISGKVEYQGEGIPGATVQVLHVEQSTGTITGLEGHFVLGNFLPGIYQLEIRSVGFKIKKLDVVMGNDPIHLKVSLSESTLSMNEIVVTGAMNPTFVAKSPVKIDVITSHHLNTYIPSASTNVVEGIALVNGVREVVACGVCFTNSISINGLPGPYTAVLMDGAPIYGNLASVYGLNGIPGMIIDQFEIIKGPSSTLYGSEAIAGVINIITKDPAKQPKVSMDVMGTSHRESFGNFSMAPKIGKNTGFVGLNYAYIHDFDDNNHDGFGDNINLDRLSFFTKWNIQRASGKRLTIAGKYYYEDRRNGVEAFLTRRAYRQLRGSEHIYGESIFTHRLELFGSYALPLISNTKLDYSLSTHLQDSYYGSDYYKANQDILFANLIWSKPLAKHHITAGITSRHQTYDDNTEATASNFTNHPNYQYIPGIFVQDEWELSKRLTTLSGLRIDHFYHHGFIASPRFSTKYELSEWTSIRSNFGTGFRIVNLFTEDHAFVTGQRKVVIKESLRPEKSYNVTFNFNHVYMLGAASQVMIDIDAFYTYFTNKITPNYEKEHQIIYANTDGFVISKGIGMNIQQEFSFPLSFSIGYNVQNVSDIESGVHRKIEFAPQWTGVVTANYRLQRWNAVLAYSSNFTGPMALPKVFDIDEHGQPLPEPRPTKSSSFSIHSLQISKDIKSHFSVYFGIQNILNYQQPWSPLAGFTDPNAPPGFSEQFDTAYAYSPIHGREVYLGIKWSLARE